MKNTAQKVLKIEDHGIMRIRVQDIVYQDGLNIKTNLELKPTEDTIELWRGRERLGFWKLEEQPIPPIPNRSRDPIKRKEHHIVSPDLRFYVVGGDNKRHRYLYYRVINENQFIVGCRSDIGARWSSTCLSRKQRKEDARLIVTRIVREKHRKAKLKKRMSDKFRQRSSGFSSYHEQIKAGDAESLAESGSNFHILKDLMEGLANRS